MQEKIIETKTCKHCQNKFNITDKDLEFYDKVSPIFNSIKFKIPTPNLCPDCRNQRRLSFRNERKLYHKKCDFTWKQIISIYSPDKPIKVYDFEVWYSDKWSAHDYAQEFDFSETFFKQFSTLLNNVPKNSIFRGNNNENSFYNNYAGDLKNCYLTFDSMVSKNVYYSTKTSFSNDCIDCTFVYYSEKCYKSISCSKCFWLFYSLYSNDCRDSYFLFNCNNCSNCYMCSNLNNKQFYFKNISYSEKEYKELVDKEIKKDFDNQYFEWMSGIDFQKLNTIIGSEKCSWAHIMNSSNCIECRDALNMQDSKYCERMQDSADCYDIFSWWDNSSLLYEWIAIWKRSSRVNFSFCTWSECLNVLYSAFLSKSCTNCFWCVWLKNAHYCILNKQYTKEQYEEIVPKIIEHMKKTWEWWEFFPTSISPFWYNETIAQDYYPLEKEQAVKKWFTWSDYEKQNWYNWEFYELLDISQYDENKVTKEIAEKNIKELLNWILKCEVSNKPYRIIKEELEFYKKNSLPIPKRHPDQRHLDRMKLRSLKIIDSEI
ncbi:MAG: hypothetical protein ACD_4C00352G0001 [uncultured bacterium (gcode 4)]|uniref:Uncharacterized protein n=1 Tax=uncultured bacterium (gcode 4) TaxID=1234023 RepID=K2F593_9BACT|nr:MAG: hypothetical protein ACD_4C00352G0001 [uncultured bacterium (gcode 4)]